MGLFIEDLSGMIDGSDELEQEALTSLLNNFQQVGHLMTMNTVITLLQVCPDTISRPYAQSFVTER